MLEIFSKKNRFFRILIKIAKNLVFSSLKWQFQVKTMFFSKNSSSITLIHNQKNIQPFIYLKTLNMLNYFKIKIK